MRVTGSPRKTEPPFSGSPPLPKKMTKITAPSPVQAAFSLPKKFLNLQFPTRNGETFVYLLKIVGQRIKNNS